MSDHRPILNRLVDFPGHIAKPVWRPLPLLPTLGGEERLELISKLPYGPSPLLSLTLSSPHLRGGEGRVRRGNRKPEGFEMASREGQ